MKRINFTCSESKEEVLLAISDNNFVNDGVKFGDNGIKPFMHVKDKGNGKLKIKCEMMGGPSKDNGFLEGTYFVGKIKDEGDGCRIRGIILTAPIFHVAMFILVAFIICQCIALKAINVIPIFAVLFDILLFKNEFKKQGYIQRYIARALTRLEKKNGARK